MSIFVGSRVRAAKLKRSKGWLSIRRWWSWGRMEMVTVMPMEESSRWLSRMKNSIGDCPMPRRYQAQINNPMCVKSKCSIIRKWSCFRIASYSERPDRIQRACYLLHLLPIRHLNVCSRTGRECDILVVYTIDHTFTDFCRDKLIRCTPQSSIPPFPPSPLPDNSFLLNFPCFCTVQDCSTRDNQPIGQ